MSTDWERILVNNDNTATENFTDAIMKAAKENIPIEIMALKQNDKPWMTSELKLSIRKRDRLFKRAKRTRYVKKTGGGGETNEISQRISTGG